MKDVFSHIQKFIASHQKMALATVIKTWGSAPRPVGSNMIVTEEGTMAGSVSGGCVEGAVVKNAAEVLKTGKPKLLGFGVTDDEAWAVGLSCGGSIQVLIEPFIAFSNPKIWKILRGCLNKNKGCILLTQLNEDKNNHILVLPNGDTIGEENLFLKVKAIKAYNERTTQIVDTPVGEKWFIQVFPPKHHLVIVGAAHITVDLVYLAKYFGFDTTIIDPRGIFAAKTDFPTKPNHLFIDWPAEILPNISLDAYTYAVMLTHDPKIDDQALHLLLASNVAYIGCLGSKKTHEKRVKRLTEAGFTAEDIAKIHAPIGVDIQAKSAREIALSIMGELIKMKNFYQ